MGRDTVKDFANMGRTLARKTLDNLGGPDQFRTKIVQTPNGPVRVRTHGGLPRSYPLGAPPAAQQIPPAVTAAWPYGGIYRSETGVITTTYGLEKTIAGFGANNSVARLCAPIIKSLPATTYPAATGSDLRFSNYQLVYGKGETSGLNAGYGRYIIPRNNGVVVVDLNLSTLFDAFDYAIQYEHTIKIEWYAGDIFYNRVSGGQLEHFKKPNTSSAFRRIKESAFDKDVAAPTSVSDCVVYLSSGLTGSPDYRLLMRDGLIIGDISPNGNKFIIEFLVNRNWESDGALFHNSMSASLHAEAWTEVDITDPYNPTSEKIHDISMDKLQGEAHAPISLELNAPRTFDESAHRTIGFFYNAENAYVKVKVACEIDYTLTSGRDVLTAVLDNASWTAGDEPNRIGLINGHALLSRASETNAAWKCSLYFDDVKQTEVIQKDSIVRNYAETYLAYTDEVNQTISVYSDETVKYARDGNVVLSDIVSPENQLWSYYYYEWLGETAESKFAEVQEYYSSLPPTHISYAFDKGIDLNLRVTGGIYGSFVGVFGLSPIDSGPPATESPPSAISDMYAVSGGFGRIGFVKLGARNYLSCVHVATTDKHFISSFNLVSQTGVTPINQEFTFLYARPWLHGGKHPITGQVEVSDKFISWV